MCLGSGACAPPPVPSPRPPLLAPALFSLPPAHSFFASSSFHPPFPVSWHAAVDLASQLVLSVAERKIARYHPAFPIGRGRLEALAVICCACIMSMASLEVAQFAAIDLYNGIVNGGWVGGCAVRPGWGLPGNAFGCVLGCAPLCGGQGHPAGPIIPQLASTSRVLCRHRVNVAPCSLTPPPCVAAPAPPPAGKLPQLDLGWVMFAILGGGTVLKLGLYFYCAALKSKSDSMEALAEDHINDVASNLGALAAAGVVSVWPAGWWVDGAAAILIALIILARWTVITYGQVRAACLLALLYFPLYGVSGLGRGWECVWIRDWGPVGQGAHSCGWASRRRPGWALATFLLPGAQKGGASSPREVAGVS